MTGFQRKAIEAAGGSWQNAKKFNDILERLTTECIPAVEWVGDLAKSTIAWKLAVYRVSLVYRGVALGQATAQLWNSRNAVVALLTARAMMETGAILRDFTDTCEVAYEAEDLKTLNKAADAAFFATRRSQVWDRPFPPAKNVLTVIDKMKKFVPEVRAHYDMLSEYAHPNHSGHFGAFGSLDPTTGRVDFSETGLFNSGMLSHVLAGAFLLGFIEIDADRLQRLIPKVAELQQDREPVGGRVSE